MGIEAGSAEETARPAQRWPLFWRHVRQQVTYLTAIVVAIVTASLALGAIASALQAERDESRSADLALVITPAIPTQAQVDHIFELYRRGYVPQIAVAGEGREGLRSRLVERGISEEVIVLVQSDDSGARGLLIASREALAADARSALIVTAPEDALMGLKVAQDQGLRAYGAPVRGKPDLLSLLAASLRYWQYALALI